MPGHFGLDLDPEQFDQPRFAVGEQRARHRTLACVGLDRNADQGVVIAFLLGLDLAHFHPALFGEERGIDHVDRIRLDPQEPGQHRRDDRLDVELCRSPFSVDRDPRDRAGSQLSDQAAELFGQSHIGLELGRFFSAQAWHIQGIGYPAVDQIIGHLLCYLQRHINLCFVGAGTKMRGADKVRGTEQGRFLGRFGLEHIERRARDMAAIHRRLQRRFVNQPAARAVNDPHALLGFGEIFGREDIAGLVRQRRVQRDEIGLGQQRIQLGLFDAHFDRAFGRQERIEGDDLHLEPQRPARHDRADIARADQAQNFAGHFDAHEIVLGPFARLSLRIRLWNLASQREHQRDGVFGGGDRVAERGVHHHHALRRSGRDIDVIDPDPGPANHFQVLGGGQNFLGHLGRGADCQTIVIADPGDQLLGRFASDHVYIAALVGKNARGVGVHLVGNEYAGFGHKTIQSRTSSP